MTATKFEPATAECGRPHGCTIRPGRAADANRLAVLATQIWLHTYATDGVSTEIADYVLAELTPAKFSDSLCDESIRVRVAERGNNLAGLALVKLNTVCPDTEGSLAELQTLYVQAHFIGTGLGKQLLQDAEAVARKQAGTALWLTVNAQNRRAIDFYNHLGYRRIGTTFFTLGAQQHENYVLLGRDA